MKSKIRKRPMRHTLTSGDIVRVVNRGGYYPGVTFPFDGFLVEEINDWGEVKVLCTDGILRTFGANSVMRLRKAT